MQGSFHVPQIRVLLEYATRDDRRRSHEKRHFSSKLSPRHDVVYRGRLHGEGTPHRTIRVLATAAQCEGQSSVTTIVLTYESSRI